MKICVKCGIEQPLDHFRKAKDGKDGHRNDCKDCGKLVWKTHYKKHRDELIQRAVRYTKEHPDKKKAKDKRYYDKHRETLLIKAKQWRDKNTEKKRKADRVWVKNNPEKVAVYSKVAAHKRRVVMNASGNFTGKEWITLCDYYGSICLACNKGTKLTADHIIPVSKGGSNMISNIQPLCKSCNSSKGTKEYNYRFWFEADMAVI